MIKEMHDALMEGGYYANKLHANFAAETEELIYNELFNDIIDNEEF